MVPLDRFSMVFFFGVGGVSCLLIMAVGQVSAAKTVLAMVGKLCISAVFSLVFLYTGELFPTSVRTTAMGVSSVASRIGAMLAPQLGLIEQYGASLPFLLFGVFSIITGAACVVLPETLGQPLPEVLDDMQASMGWPGCRRPRRPASIFAGLRESHGQANNNGQDKPLLLNPDST